MHTKISKAIKKDLEKKAKPKQLSRQVSEVEAKISNQQYLQKNEDVIINAKPLDSYSESFQYNGKNYILTMDLVTETETDSLYSVITTDTEENLFLDTKSISCKINLAHPFFTRFEHFKKGQDYAPIVAIFKALTLAEIMAPDKGTKFASNLRILFNQNILQ